MGGSREAPDLNSAADLDVPAPSEGPGPGNRRAAQ